MKKFIISIISRHVLTEEDLWPDGDAPPNPTVSDVEALIYECGGPEAIITEWNMDITDLVITEVR